MVAVPIYSTNGRVRIGVPARVLALLVVGACLAVAQAGADTASKTDADAALLARTALMPYANARAYKGACTTTTVTGKDRSEVTTTTTWLVRCGEGGTITRLRGQTLSWGHEDDREIAGALDSTITYDGKTLWVYRPAEQRYSRLPTKPANLMSLLGLPQREAAWSFVPSKRHDTPGERTLRALIDEEEWKLVVDTAGRLRRVERSSGKGAQRTVTTTLLRDLAFDADVNPTESRFVFQPPPGAQESLSSLALALPLP